MKTQAQNAFNRRRSRIDWIARRLMTFSGWLVLAMFLLLIGHIASHILPLFKTPTLQLDYSVEYPASAVPSHVVNLFSGSALVAKQNCDVVLFAAQNPEYSAQPLMLKKFPFACESIVDIHSVGADTLVSAMKADGLLEIYRLESTADSAQLQLATSVALPISIEKAVGADSTSLSYLFSDLTLTFHQQRAVAIVSYKSDGAQKTASVPVTSEELTQPSTTNQAARHVSHWFDLAIPQILHTQALPSAQNVLALPHIQQIMLINQKSAVFVDRFNKQLSVQQLPQVIDKVKLSPNQGTVFAFYNNKKVARWFLQNQEDGWVVTLDANSQRKLHSELTDNVFDPNSNAGIEFYADASYAFFNSITGQVFSWYNDGVDVASSQWIANNIYAISGSRLHVFSVNNVHGVTTFQELLGKNWYEGYDEPSFVWQTSSAAQHYDAKYSVIPLLIGSLKASFLALVVAIPLAVGAAMYTSFFATSGVKKYLKPSIEMLEAVPSVIIGFIAAVWLAPLAEQFLISILLFLVLLPFFLLASAILQPLLAAPLNQRFSRNWEVFFIMVSTFLLALISFGLGELWQQYLVDMNAGTYVDSLFAISKTTLVVAVALGVAISPTIYSMADDALSEVPEGLIKASFALGATRLQTLRNVVIRVALPSLISAVMLGFGRAFGETMIVLMVTGNTPISDWSIFEGLRSLTANLAIELQEANINSAHFNVLFLTAGLLFLFTFVINTGAELFRNRLRKVVGHGKN